MLEDLVAGVTESVGFGIGAGVIAVAAGVLVGAGLLKPLTKGAIKGYLVATQGVRGAVAGATESMQDLYAEAKHEYETDSQHENSTKAEAETSTGGLGGAEPGQQPA